MTSRICAGNEKEHCSWDSMNSVPAEASEFEGKLHGDIELYIISVW